jgi:hypothetical protein
VANLERHIWEVSFLPHSIIIITCMCRRTPKESGEKRKGKKKTPSKKSQTKLLVGVNEFKGVAIERGLVEGVKERERERHRAGS